MKKSGNPITHIGALEVEALGSDASPDGERLLPRFVADAGTPCSHGAAGPRPGQPFHSG